ncbi:MAG: hypothetical protein ACYTGN_02745 [Planctomycetota bacterium]|jgi:hypothetical protein
MPRIVVAALLLASYKWTDQPTLVQMPLGATADARNADYAAICKILSDYVEGR